ncbi:CotH kinase family protein [Pedobacter frigoris]|uniref:CotH kinase family protein n=1 Tax=Pedobacter frigoris TaxID=2571272 RepID=UPI00292D9804|nr:CotH kinase family protein [Pedobacter frigoris]
MNQTKKYLLLLIIGSSILWSCRKQDIKHSSKELQFFKIEAKNNNGVISKDIDAKIENNNISLELPEGVPLTNLKATFGHNGLKVLVNSIEQQSTQTSNDFSKQITYTIKAEDDSESNYPVTISIKADPGLVLSTFSFLRINNTDLKQDYNLVINNVNVSSELKHFQKQLIATFATPAIDVTVNGIKQQSGITVNDFSTPVTYILTSETGTKKQYTVTVKWISEVPHIYIVTTGNAPVVSKDDYLTATIKIEGNTAFKDFNGTTKIKGRGNSTWNYPKKPYRLKLDSKAALLGLAEDKDWVLLANYIDPTLMLNAVAMKTGQLLDIPYTNHIIPVDLTVNGTYMGSYSFTEQVAVAKNRVNIEDGGTLFELDSYYDEPWKFKSTAYNLPVMIKYPDLTTQDQLNTIKTDFQVMENAISATSFPNNNYTDYIDINILADVLIVYMLTDNQEINHPKSTYMYKPKNGKYTMGPLWDFDWAYGYEGSYKHFSKYNAPLLPITKTSPGTLFFSRLLSDPKVKTLFKQKWAAFKSSKLPQLLTYIDDYAATLEPSKARDYTKWNTGSGNFKLDVASLKTWIQNRSTYIDTYTAGF